MKIGVVGLGFRMGRVARLLCEADRNIRLVGYVDPNPAGMGRLNEGGIDPGVQFDDLDTMLKQGGIDLLMVGSPNHLHLEHIRAGLESGVQVFSEKPVVTTEAESWELAGLLGKHGVDSVLVGLVLRYAPLYTDLRRVQAEGTLGDIVSIDASEHIAPYHGAFFMRDWRRYARYSGSYMLEKCCHDLDIYQGVVGARASRVASFGGRKSFVPENAPTLRGINDMEIYHRKPSGWQGTDRIFDSDADIIDYQTAIVEYASGTTMAFHCNLNVPEEIRRFCIVGTQGMAEGDFARNYFRVHDARSGQKLVDRSYDLGAYSGHYGADEQMAADLASYFNTGAALPVNVINALEAGLTAIKIDEARVSGRTLDLDETWRRFDEALGEVGSK